MRPVFVCLALIACACTSVPDQKSVSGVEDETPEQSGEVFACPTYGPVDIILLPQIGRQGSTLEVVVSENLGPAGGRAVERSRLSNWMVSPASAATLSKDRTSLTISPTAPAGEQVTVSASLCGETIESRIRVVGLSEIVLTGTWSQKAVSCKAGEPPSEAVRELQFTNRGGFAVTYYPFESYQDYWGDATFDSASGALKLAQTGGNMVPPGLDLEGRAILQGDTLVLEDVYLGDRAPQRGGECRYEFGRLGRGG